MPVCQPVKVEGSARLNCVKSSLRPSREPAVALWWRRSRASVWLRMRSCEEVPGSDYAGRLQVKQRSSSLEHLRQVRRTDAARPTFHQCGASKVSPAKPSIACLEVLGKRKMLASQLYWPVPSTRPADFERIHSRTAMALIYPALRALLPWSVADLAPTIAHRVGAAGTCSRLRGADPASNISRHGGIT